MTNYKALSTIVSHYDPLRANMTQNRDAIMIHYEPL